MKSCRLILKLGMEAEETVLLLMADFHTASPLQVPELGSPKDVRQREQTLGRIWGIAYPK